MANQRSKPHNPNAFNFASDQDSWDKASPEFKDHLMWALMGVGEPPPKGSSHHLPEEDEGDEEHEGQTEADRQREREEE